jgi:hypothetical protein
MRCAAKTGLRMSQNEHRYRLLDYTLFNLRHSLAAQKCKSMRMDMFTSEYASMKGQAGNLVNPSSLRGTSVALDLLGPAAFGLQEHIGGQAPAHCLHHHYHASLLNPHFPATARTGRG